MGVQQGANHAAGAGIDLDLLGNSIKNYKKRFPGRGFPGSSEVVQEGPATL